MKKILFFLLFSLTFLNIHAQLDREHWFAPMVDRSGNPNPFQSVYLSTNRATPFPVTIYNNNVPIATVNLSKGNPQKVEIPRNLIITTSQTELFTPITKGLYVKGEFPFYANLRFSVYNHGEIITSKGIPSTGKSFYVANAPITVQNNILNFMTSVLATEDNTTVTISNYKPTVNFSNGTTGASNPTMTFTLNKGQSYIIDGSGLTNTDGFIGAKINANKPVNVTNGNFNGQYAGPTFTTSSDILMDQSVPIEHLGTQFALVKGNGAVGTNMEGAIVIATQNNTEVYVNDSGLPIATLNDGDYYFINDTNYKLQGTSHYNLFIRTTKNAYVYQLLAGDSNANVTATGGFNFIPALNCYLPKQINELGLIDENFVYSNANPNGILNIPTKLNLITERGASVQVNGVTPPTTTGPFDMTGNTNWVTYGIPNVSGTLTITSNKAITAGINAGSDAVGYGGFFAGFPTTPVILTSGGTCVPGIVLTVDPVIYDTYQWYRDGILIPNATNVSYTPTQSGVYTCSVTMGSCAPLVTLPYSVQSCMVQSTATYTTCSNQVITPAFSTSTQTIVTSTISIVTPPSSGTATINPATGQITYTPNNTTGTFTDTFSYTFCGNHATFPDCETVTVTIHVAPIPVNNVTLNACNINGTGTFNLNNAVVTGQTPVTIQYYPTLADAQNQNTAAEINNTNNYPAANGTVVYALVMNPQGCKNIAEITLNLYPYAQVLDNFTHSVCDDNLDGSVSLDLTTLSAQIVQNSTYFNIKYYANLADATAGNTSVLPTPFTYSATTTVYIRVESPDGCQPVIKPLTLSIGNKITLLSLSQNVDVCDDDLDGFKSVNLNDYTNLFTNDPAVNVTYHVSLLDAQNGVSPLNMPITASGITTYYLRFTKVGECPNVAELKITIKTPKKSDQLESIVLCEGQTGTLDAGPGFEAYLWSTGETTQSINAVIGNYWVDLTFNGCIYRQYVNVLAPITPYITLIEINGNNATIHVAGGTPPYEYSLDNINWQTSNVFTNLPRGTYTVYVRDKYSCTPVKKKFIIINLINAVTPNGDGINDTVDYSDLRFEKDIQFVIFDRYGTEIFRGSKENNYTWNGRFGGKPVFTATYWYILNWRDADSETQYKYHSWLVVKNRD